MQARRYSRKEAAEVLRGLGLRSSYSTLEKLAIEGEGPLIEYWGRFPTYPEAELLTWAQSRLSKPVRSTAERHTQAA